MEKAMVKKKKAPKNRGYGGGCGIRTHVRLLSNGFQDFLTNPTLPQNKRKYQTIENAENPVNSRAFGVFSFPKSKTPSGARISVSKTISKTFLEKSLDKSAPISPVASHIIYAKFAATDYSQNQLYPHYTPTQGGITEYSLTPLYHKVADSSRAIKVEMELYFSF